MGWARGRDNNGEEVGYGVPDVCWTEGCEAAIDRGLYHACGGLDSPRFGGDEGCGGYFCGEHITGENLCMPCAERRDVLEGETARLVAAYGSIEAVDPQSVDEDRKATPVEGGP